MLSVILFRFTGRRNFPQSAFRRFIALRLLGGLEELVEEEDGKEDYEEAGVVVSSRECYRLVSVARLSLGESIMMMSIGPRESELSRLSVAEWQPLCLAWRGRTRRQQSVAASPSLSGAEAAIHSEMLRRDYFRRR